MRIGRHQMFMEIAHTVAKRSTCFRLNVGAVLTVHNRIVSLGYNGRPPGMPHCEGDTCPGREGCHETIHAEDNAIRYLSRDYYCHETLTLYVTDSPCQHCAELISEVGIRRVFFSRPYRLTDSLQWLWDNGISCYQVMPSGYVVEWLTKRIVEDA